MIQAFTARGADETFGERVRPWRPYRRLDYPGTDVGEHRVERCSELRVAIPDQKTEPGGPPAQIHDQVACLLRDPRPARMTGNAQNVHTPGVELHHEEHCRRSRTVSTCKKSHASNPCACARRNCRQLRLARRGPGLKPAAARLRRTVPSLSL